MPAETLHLQAEASEVAGWMPTDPKAAPQDPKLEIEQIVEVL
jgi:hypothetical protein